MVTSTTAIVRWGLWFAFLTGLGQALLVGKARLSTDRIVMIKSDVVWMAPLTNAVIFTIAALVVGLCTLRIERMKAASVALFVFVFLMVIAPLLMVPRLHRYAAVVLGVGLAIQTVRI